MRSDSTAGAPFVVDAIDLVGPRMTEHSRTLPARLTIFGFEPTAGQMDVEYRPRSIRMTRTLVSLALFWGIAPIVLLIPPHIEWALGALIAGVYYARKNWKAEYIVKAFEGPCPSCRTGLELKAGTMIRFPHGLTCFECHHEPMIEAGR